MTSYYVRALNASIQKGIRSALGRILFLTSELIVDPGTYTHTHTIYIHTLQTHILTQNMDHIFGTKRPELQRLRTAKQSLEDLHIFLNASSDDRARVADRLDADVQDASVREALYRHARQGLGGLIDRIRADVGTVAAMDEAVWGEHTRTWKRWLSGEDVAGTAQPPLMERIGPALQERIAHLADIEADSASSSYSDYSDSDTVSTSDNEGMEGEDDGEEGESEGEEDESGYEEDE